MNYLIQESEHVGKGADTVISLVNHFFNKKGIGEKYLTIHADNCSGQNKNNAMIHYLAWRVLTGQHTKIVYSFMVPGHTKFSPDGFFGLIKLKLKKAEVDDLDDLIKNVVEKSTGGNFNIAQPIFNENGDREVFFYYWTEFFNKMFKPVPNLLKYYHFIFDSECPNIIKAKKTLDGELEEIEIIKSVGFLDIMEPREKLPTGISLERQWYLYENVREHVQNPNKRDIYCPHPLLPKPRKNQ